MTVFRMKSVVSFDPTMAHGNSDQTSRRGRTIKSIESDQITLQAQDAFGEQSLGVLRMTKGNDVTPA